MIDTPGNLRDLWKALVSYHGLSTSAGNVGGSTLVCSDLTSEADFDGLCVVIVSGTYKGRRSSINGATTGGTVTLLDAMGGQIATEVEFVIVPLDASCGSILAIVVGATGILCEQADVAVDISVLNASPVDVLDLNTAATRYLIRDLWLKSADPGANTVTVSLEKLINDVAIVVDTFDITTANFAEYFSLMDMFGLQSIGGDDIHIYAQASAGGPYAMTGQYSHAKTNN